MFRSILKNYKNITRCFSNKIINTSSEIINEIEDFNEDYEKIANKCFLNDTQNIFIIHPYFKWGPKKIKSLNIEYEISEAKSLINTLKWFVIDCQVVPIENLDKKLIFGTGNLEKLKNQIRPSKATAVFVNVGTLKNKQILEFENLFGVKILDRYKIVMQILRLHAISKHAKLQVNLAEIPYLRSKLKYIDITTTDNWKIKDKFLQDRQQKLKLALKKLRNQRQLLRNKRKDLNFPVVAIVGYTNVGKTSLIKTLTGDKNLSPKNELFATLDVTVHSGFLPSKLQILYVDTVGFIKDIPTDLIECFIATLEDAMLADVIIHVQDISNENLIHHRKHVQSVLENLAEKIGQKDLNNKLINVGNKIDCCQSQNLENMDRNLVLVSAKDLTGIEKLKQTIEEYVLKNTNRHKISLKVPTGGEEMRWLFKNATVVTQIEDSNPQFQILDIIITESNLKKFNNYFCTN